MALLGVNFMGALTFHVTFLFFCYAWLIIWIAWTFLFAVQKEHYCITYYLNCLVSITDVNTVNLAPVTQTVFQ